MFANKGETVTNIYWIHVWQQATAFYLSHESGSGGRVARPSFWGPKCVRTGLRGELN